MKRFLFSLAILALLLPAMPRASGADVSIDFFYNNLSGGSWLEVGDYGYCWQPDAAVNDPDWRPYADGYWAYTDVGWTWVSYEDFGWATYHYGRWAKLADYGWVWVPGADLEWGPAWVSWRTGGDYIGWAPLPPRDPGIVYEDRPIGAQVDVEFDIGPEYYNFCDVRYIGEPVLRNRIVPVRQNITYIDRTVNVTNITVTNNIVYNYGPDIKVINQHSSRPIQQLHIQREENVDMATVAKSGEITKVQGNALVVAAPLRITKSTKQEAPTMVKGRVQQAKIEKGWAGVDPNQQTTLREKIKTEDHTKVPVFGAGSETSGQNAASLPTTSASPAPSVGAMDQGLGKRKRLEPNATATPLQGNVQGENQNRPGGHRGGSEGGNVQPSPSVTSEETRRDNGRVKHLDQSPAPSVQTENGQDEKRNRPGRQPRKLEQATSPAGGQPPQNPSASVEPTRGGKLKSEKTDAANGGGGEGKHEGREKSQASSPSPSPQ